MTGLPVTIECRPTSCGRPSRSHERIRVHGASVLTDTARLAADIVDCRHHPDRRRGVAQGLDTALRRGAPAGQVGSEPAHAVRVGRALAEPALSGIWSP
jgi:hypothetical protein